MRGRMCRIRRCIREKANRDQSIPKKTIAVRVLRAALFFDAEQFVGRDPEMRVKGENAVVRGLLFAAQPLTHRRLVDAEFLCQRFLAKPFFEHQLSDYFAVGHICVQKPPGKRDRCQKLS